MPGINELKTKMASCFEAKGLPPDEAAKLADFCADSYDPAADFLRPEFIDRIHKLSPFAPDLLSFIKESAGEAFSAEEIRLAVWAGHVLRFVRPEYEYLCNYNDFYSKLDEPRAGIAALYGVMSGLDKLAGLYRERGIPEKYLCDTLSDVAVWTNHARRKGVTGLRNDGWVAFTMRAAIFKVGRLQYEPASLNYGSASYTGGVLTAGRNVPVLSVHVQEGGTLGGIDESFTEALEFFRLYFPEKKFSAFVCCSWLLDDCLIEMLGEDSNILKFKRRFTLLPGQGGPNAVERVFGDAGVDLESFVPKTSLQKKMREYILGGDRVGDRFGVIEIE